MSGLERVQAGRGEVYLQGAHVTRWSADDGDVLFVSRRARFEPGVPIRGGVPVIFPWFGDDPDARGRPAHGFARRVPWRLVEPPAPGGERAVLELVDDDATRALWPHRFALRLAVTFGRELGFVVRVANRDDHAWRCEIALHTYLAVGDVLRASLRGLGGATFFDKRDGMRRKVQHEEPLRFDGAIDRTYVGTGADCVVEDPAAARSLTVRTTGARSTVVWNPWRDGVAAFADLGADEWQRFLCVESGDVAGDALVLPPGGEHTMLVVLSASPLAAAATA